MLFVELQFFPFFLTAFAVHWLLRSGTARKAWLLVASYVFYAGWDWRFLFLIAASTLVDYVAGLRIARPGARRRAWLALSLGVNLGLLGVFKYLDFFLESTAALLASLGLEPNVHVLGIVLPVGISFYTFQTLSYTLDVYAGRLRPTRNLLDLALFVAFFPQLVAGPIVRARDFLPQLEEERLFARVDVRAALVLFLVGFVKKSCISDNLAPIVDAFHQAPQEFDSLGAWTAILFYAVQIYCDFSGYSDMAIACAALLGYRLCLNFHYPYLAPNLSDFWRRWHISLSTWLRDYVFVPLGGSRRGPVRTWLHLSVTFLLCGLWHGASWNFVLFGALHAAGMVGRLVWRGAVPAASWLGRAARAAGVPLTFLFFTLSLIAFRGLDLERTGIALRSSLLFDAPGTRDFGGFGLALFAALAAVHWVAYRRLLGGWWRALPTWVFAAGYGATVAVVLAFVPLDARPFVYFQF